MHLLRSPRTSLIAAVLLPVLLTGCIVLAVYLPGFPGRPPRDIGGLLFWLPPLSAVVLLQLFPFGSLVLRVLATFAFGGAMFAVLLMLYFFGACSFGDCM